MKCNGIKLFIIFVFLVMQACSTNKQIASSVPLDAIETSEIIKNSKKTEVNFGNPPHTISSGNSDASGHGNFEYAVPSGYFALCTKNLATHG